jgi:hypothetical protein
LKLQKYAKIHHLGVIIPKYGWKMTSKWPHFDHWSSALKGWKGCNMTGIRHHFHQTTCQTRTHVSQYSKDITIQKVRTISQSDTCFPYVFHIPTRFSLCASSFRNFSAGLRGSPAVLFGPGPAPAARGAAPGRGRVRLPVAQPINATAKQRGSTAAAESCCLERLPRLSMALVFDPS